MKKNVFAVRLSPREERLLSETQKILKMSRSAIVREAIVRYAAQAEKESGATVAERLGDLIGSISGPATMSRDTGKRYREALRKKYGGRSR